MAMTLEDAQRVFGKARGGVKRRVRELEGWGYEARRGARDDLPPWAPIAVAAAAGLLVGAALLWASETHDHRVRAILRRAEPAAGRPGGLSAGGVRRRSRPSACLHWQARHSS